ncbi:MAG: hypothetical protein L3J36_01120 [Rhodobacteraceae bacterium]|nr:hypothetical protein [Paracoccaceae bacterium]
MSAFVMLNGYIEESIGALMRRTGLFPGLIALSGLIPASIAAADPPFSSTADTVFDIITVDDPSHFTCLSYTGRTTRQMWDKRVDNEFDFNVYLFTAHFDDSPPFDIIVNPEFGSREAAEAEARRYTRPLGQLPLVLRHGIRQFGIHKGNPTFSAGAGKIFVYSDRTTTRIGQNHLEESLLHEAVHATLDRKYRQSDEWIAAQVSDGRFVTRYAASRPEREDMAETALFAYGLIRHPGRIPPVDSRDILAAVPARIAFVKDLLNQTPQVPPAPVPPENCH